MATEKGPPCSSLEAELVSLLDLCLPVHILLAFSASSAAISSQLPCLLFVLQPTASTFLSNCSFELYHEFAHHPTKWQLSASILLARCAPAFAVGLFILLCDVSLMSWELFLSVPVNLLQLSVLSPFLLPWFSSIPLLLGLTIIYLQKSPNQHLHFSQHEYWADTRPCRLSGSKETMATLETAGLLWCLQACSWVISALHTVCKCVKLVNK